MSSDERRNTGASSTTVVRDYRPEVGLRRVLLFNPPVYDTRFPWSRWQQPVALLQLATLLRRSQCDVRLVDALHVQSHQRLTRHRVRVLTRGAIPVYYWRFGRLQSELIAQCDALSREGWQPDDIYLDGFTTFWWEGVAESITLVRRLFPRARVILCGAYPSLATGHAVLHSGADVLAVGSIEGLAGLPLDLSLYATRPCFTYLSIGTDARPSSDLVDEFLSKASPRIEQERIRQFAFVDYNVVSRFPEQFRALLRKAIDHKLKVSFYALGNLRPRDLIDDPELASLLFHAGFKQLVFSDDRDLPLTHDAREELLADYRCAIERCITAGYRWRTEALAASVCLGRPGEQPGEVAAFMALLAHVAGSVIAVPYQPTPAECTADLALEDQNGKLFPFAEHNGMSYRAYQDMLGLAAVLNAKYRDHTFDFLGDGLIARLVRSSLVSESWNPHNTSSNDRPVIAGWFNKEGRWVRS